VPDRIAFFALSRGVLWYRKPVAITNIDEKLVKRRQFVDFSGDYEVGSK